MNEQESKYLAIPLFYFQGRKTALSSDVENKLTECLRQMVRLGFGPMRTETMEIVRDYIIANKIPTRFKNGHPGVDWLSSFMGRHKLKLKKGGQMQIARKNVTSDPFVIYEFYELLKNEVECLGIQNKPESIFNCDESGFPSDPSKIHHIGPVGEKSIQITCGANHENTTVLVVCNANGEALDPLVVFRGKHLLSNWKGDQALPNTYFAVTENGWMTSEIFHDWLKMFLSEQKVCPLILIFD